ncbi:MAG: hypothetical protein LBU79_02450 [Planctomycetota bacterium]|nr:hypothetical protein [Planctomycetota bacterium]
MSRAAALLGVLDWFLRRTFLGGTIPPFPRLLDYSVSQNIGESLGVNPR